MKMLRVIAALFTASLSASAFAGPLYTYSIDNPTGSAGAGDIKNVTTSYDAGTEEFSWSYTIGRDGSNNLSDAFWLVVSDGPNPKNQQDELAILYGDVAGNKITAYEYNGLNSNSSYSDPANLLDSFVGLTVVDDDQGTAAIGDDLRTISFSIDATVINAGTDLASWKGVQFGDQLGIWFHPSSNSTISYNGSGEITSYNYSRQGWYDTNYRTTTEVPEPSALLLFALGLLGLGLVRRSQRSAARADAFAVAA